VALSESLGSCLGALSRFEVPLAKRTNPITRCYRILRVCARNLSRRTARARAGLQPKRDSVSVRSGSESGSVQAFEAAGLDVPTPEGGTPATVPETSRSSDNRLRLKEALKIIDLVRPVYRLGVEPIAFVEALIQKEPENAKELCSIWGVPYAFAGLTGVVADRSVVEVLQLAYEVGLL